MLHFIRTITIAGSVALAAGAAFAEKHCRSRDD